MTEKNENVSLQSLSENNKIEINQVFSDKMTSFTNDEICDKSIGEYLENYPALQLNEKEAKERAKKFQIKKKMKITTDSSMKQFLSRFDVWKSIDRIIGLNHDSEAVVFFKLNRWLTFNYMFVCFLTVCFIILPILIFYISKSSSHYEDLLPDVSNKLLPNDESWLINTPLFYGFYNYSNYLEYRQNYSISRSYFWINAITRAIFMVFLLKKLIVNISMTYVTKSMDNMIRPGQLLGIWNFKSGSLLEQVSSKTVVRDFIKKVMSTKNTKSEISRAMNVIVNLLCYILIMVVIERFTYLLSEDSKNNQNGSLNFRSIIITPAIIASVSIVATLLFDIIRYLETYDNDSLKIFTTILRIAILNISILLVVIIHYTTLIECAQFYRYSNNTSTSSNMDCQLSRTTIKLNTNSLLLSCWETWLGQKLLILIMCYIILSFIIYFIVDLFKLAIKYIQIISFRPKFFQRSLIGNLIVIEGLFWLGYYYCPFLSIIWVGSYILSYFYQLGMISLCAYRSSTNQSLRLHKTLFLLVLLISTVIGCTCWFYHCYRLTPSTSCGPFVHLSHNFDPEDLNSVKEVTMLKLVFWLIDIATGHNGLWYACITLILALLIRYSFRSLALREITKQLKSHEKQIVIDKRFLHEKWQPLKQKVRKSKTHYSTKKLNLNPEEIEEFYNRF